MTNAAETTTATATATATAARMVMRSTETCTDTQVEQFGVCDGSGREIGARVALLTIVHAERAERHTGEWSAPYAAGTIYAYQPTALRAGRRFGAIARRMDFDTAEQRDAAVAKYFANARKRAAKTAAK